MEVVALEITHVHRGFNAWLAKSAADHADRLVADSMRNARFGSYLFTRVAEREGPEAAIATLGDRQAPGNEKPGEKGRS